MLDSAVTWFGITVENALSERDKVKFGDKVEYRPRYSLSRLLNPAFKLPRPPEDYVDGNVNPWSPLLAWAGKKNSGVRRWAYKPPIEDTTAGTVEGESGVQDAPNGVQDAPNGVQGAPDSEVNDG